MTGNSNPPVFHVNNYFDIYLSAIKTQWQLKTAFLTTFWFCKIWLTLSTHILQPSKVWGENFQDFLIYCVRTHVENFSKIWEGHQGNLKIFNLA